MVESIKELRKICVKKGDPLDARIFFFSRKVSIYVTKLLLYTPITANQVTLLFIFIATVSGVFFTLGDYKYSIIGWGLYGIHRILDCVDGEIARYRKQSSVRGIYLDLISHYFIGPFIGMCISLGVYKELHEAWIIMLGFSISLSIVLQNAASDCWYKAIAKSSTSAPSEKNTQAQKNAAKVASSGNMKWVVYYIVAFFRTDSFINLFMLAGFLDLFLQRITVGSFVLNYKSIVICLYAIALPLFSVARIAYSFHKGGVVGRATILE